MVIGFENLFKNGEKKERLTFFAFAMIIRNYSLITFAA
jgi:hypothetical protein